MPRQNANFHCALQSAKPFSKDNTRKRRWSKERREHFAKTHCQVTISNWRSELLVQAHIPRQCHFEPPSHEMRWDNKTESDESESMPRQNANFHFPVPKVLWKSHIWTLGSGILFHRPGSFFTLVLVAGSLITLLQTYNIIEPEGG